MELLSHEVQSLAITTQYTMINGYHEWVYSNTAVRYTVARFSLNSSANLRKKKTNKSQTEVPSKLLGTSV